MMSRAEAKLDAESCLNYAGASTKEVNMSNTPRSDKNWISPMKPLTRIEDTPLPSEEDVVNHPSHYRGNGFEAIKVIEAWNLGFCLGNTVKYISRAGKKPGNSELQDLEKAAWYLNRRIEQIKQGAEPGAGG